MPIMVFESSGRGPSAVLVHGNSTSSKAFQHQLAGALGDEFRLVAIDLPGHGESCRPRDASTCYSLPGFATVLAGVAEALCIENSVFVGWSLGGHIVLEAAKHLPKAAGFCVFGTPPVRVPPNFEQAFLPHPVGKFLFQENLTQEEAREWVASYFCDSTSCPPTLVEDIGRTDRRMRPSLLASLGTAGYADETEVVAGLRQPIAILHGVRDVLINREYIASLPTPSLWRGRIQDIDAGHAPQWERPAEFDALIRDFIYDVS
jgi:pimeloyl-ACP methyl ester carboxylesterase